MLSTLRNAQSVEHAQVFARLRHQNWTNNQFWIEKPKGRLQMAAFFVCGRLLLET
jgi:hypothetical protein